MTYIVAYSAGKINSNVIGRSGDWNTYKRELEQMGVPRFVEIYQEAYDANMGN